MIADIGNATAIHSKKDICISKFSCIKPTKKTFGAVPMIVLIPPILAE